MIDTGTYGLGTSMRGPAGAPGGGLAGAGLSQQQSSNALLKEAASEEQARNIHNDQIKQADKAGKAQLGSAIGSAGGMAIGAQYGAAAGPWGALIGGVVGALASSQF